jgi:hypothetical protein
MRLESDRKRELENRLWWFWLSYASNDGFLGAVFIEAKTMADAATLAWNRGIAPAVNPQVLRITERDEKALLDMTPDSFRNRLLTLEDLEELKTLGHEFTSGAQLKQKEEQKNDPLLKKAMDASKDAAKGQFATIV